MNWEKLSKDNLPPFKVPVLVFGEGRVGVAFLRYCTVTHDDSGTGVSYTFVEKGYDEYPYNITHWMLFPEPPKP